MFHKLAAKTIIANHSQVHRLNLKVEPTSCRLTLVMKQFVICFQLTLIKLQDIVFIGDMSR